MKRTPSRICFVFTLCLLAGIVSSYDISLSDRYLRIEVHKWSNFTVHVASKGVVYTDSVTIEVNHTSNIRISPKIIEMYTKNFSSWCHMFHVLAIKPGVSRILFNFGNDTIRNEVGNLEVGVDIVKSKALEPYADWCRKYYYIFSVISVYPQILMQYLRLSVVGLDMDYVCFNFIGHLAYSVYTLFMYTRMESDPGTKKEEFPVTLSENMFALHGLIVSILLGIQAIKYYGVDKRVSVIGKELISFYGIVFVFGFLLTKFDIIQYTEFLDICRYIHIASMSTKYIPQLYKNYINKCTFGWNIWNSNFELTGCIALIINFIMVSYNYDNWTIMVIDVLFWMVCAISLQHISFIIQHYIIYKKWTQFDLNELQEITLQEKMTLYEQRLDPRPDHC